MNHELNAAMAILSGSLRPWVKENQDEEKFKQLLNHNVRAQKDNGAPFFTALISAYKKTGIGIEHEIIREFSDLEKAPRSAEVIDKIAPFELPLFFNKQTEFYSYLIRNEFFGTLLYVDHLVMTMEAIDARYNIQKVFKMIGSILGQLNEVTHTDKTTVFILDNLRISLYFIHQELKRLYSDYIDFEILSENELIYQLATDNNDEKSRIAGFINQYRASCQLIRQENETKQTGRITVRDEAIRKTKGSSKDEKIILNSFTYIHLYEKKKDYLTDLWCKLKEGRFIDDKTSIVNFKKVFSGKEILNPVKWTGNPSELYWFIHLIYTKYKLVNDLRQNQWKVTCLCFVQSGGSPFDRNQFRNLKRPQLTGKLLEQAVELLK